MTRRSDGSIPQAALRVDTNPKVVGCTEARWPQGKRSSAADLKFLHRVPRVRLSNFKAKSGTRIIELLVPLVFEVRTRVCPRCITNFENRALGQPFQLSFHGICRVPDVPHCF